MKHSSANRLRAGFPLYVHFCRCGRCLTNSRTRRCRHATVRRCCRCVERRSKSPPPTQLHAPPLWFSSVAEARCFDRQLGHCRWGLKVYGGHGSHVKATIFATHLRCVLASVPDAGRGNALLPNTTLPKPQATGPRAHPDNKHCCFSSQVKFSLVPAMTSYSRP